MGGARQGGGKRIDQNIGWWMGKEKTILIIMEYTHYDIDNVEWYNVFGTIANLATNQDTTLYIYTYIINGYVSLKKNRVWPAKMKI